MNEIQVYERKINQTLSVADQIMMMPKYRKMQKEEILAILQTSHSLGIDPFLALNKDLYAINGKIEMSAELMNRLIRKAGHSVHVKQLDNQVCILIGKRKDTQEEMEASFSIADAQAAGIYKNAWMKFPQDMLWARSLSRLGRRLFPDVLCGCFVQGEISNPSGADVPEPQTLNDEDQEHEEVIECITKPMVSSEQVRELAKMMQPYQDVYKTVMGGLEKKYNVGSLYDLTPQMYDKIVQFVKNQIKIQQEMSQ